MSTPDGGPAFPCEGDYDTRFRRHYASKFTGMSLRDYFAGQALVCAGPILAAQPQTFTGAHADFIAQRCYVMADAMLKAREAK